MYRTGRSSISTARVAGGSAAAEHAGGGVEALVEALSRPCDEAVVEVAWRRMATLYMRAAVASVAAARAQAECAQVQVMHTRRASRDLSSLLCGVMYVRARRACKMYLRTAVHARPTDHAPASGTVPGPCPMSCGGVPA